MHERALFAVTCAFALTAFDVTAAAHGRHRRTRERAVAVYTRAGLPNIQAQGAVVLDLTTGDELFLKNPDAVRPIASISKLMATMVVLDRDLDLDGVTVITKEDARVARGGAHSRLTVGASFTNRDLLHAALMASDNRAVPALGRAVGLDPAAMVSAMNDKARALGLKNTHFEDPVGLNSQNTSTPRDVAGMLKAAIKQSLISTITQKPRYTVHPVGRPRLAIDYNNTDVIARSGHFSVLTGKTGYTDLALYCLAIAVRMATDHEVAMVFLGAAGKMTRFADFLRTAQWLVERKFVRPKVAAEAKPL